MQDARRNADLPEKVDRFQRGVLSGVIGVIRDDDLFGILPHEAALIGGERRAERGDGIRKARLIQRDHIHIALREDQPLFAGFPRELHGKEVSALFERDGVCGVEIFRNAVVLQNRSAAECDHRAAQIEDRKDHAVAEFIVEPACALGNAAEIRGDQFFLRKALFGHCLREGIPFGICKAKPVFLDGFRLQGAFRKIGQPALVVPAELLIVEAGSGAV